LNIIGALKNGKITAPFAFEGSCDTEVFNSYLQEVLKPILEKGDVIVLDNASFHKASNITAIAKDAGAIVEYLPPYSPDLNKIEGCWHSIKTRFRRHIQKSNMTPIEAITEVFMHENLNC